jgi:adenosylcobinamide-GDP ribazoletransferase
MDQQSGSRPNQMPDLISWLLDQYAELSAAVRFLSILPLPDPPHRIETGSETTSPVRVVLGSGYFSLVGLLLGLLLSILLLLLDPLLPHLAVAALLVVTLVLLTGGLHLDGLMDSYDGLFGGRTPERRLEIMRDSRVGSFGVLGGVCALLLKFAFFASLERHALLVALLVVLPSARWAMVLALHIFPSARSRGLGVTFQQTVTLQRLVLAGSIALIIALVLAHLAGALLWGAATLTAIALGSWITRRIGGLTGDTYGAIAEITEVVMLLLLLLLRSWL